MKFLRTLFLSIIVVAVSCKKDEDPGKIKYLASFQIDKGYYFSSEEIWFVGWDDNGTLLDYKKYDPDQTQTVNLETRLAPLETGSFTLGVFRLNGSGNPSVNIYTDLGPGASFVRHKQEFPDAKGTFRVHYPAPTEPGQPRIDISSELFGQVWQDLGENYLDCIIDPTASKYNFFYHDESGLRHKLLTDVKDGDDITIDDTDLVPYENTASFNLPSTYENVSVSLTGFESDDPGYGFDLDYFTHTTLSNAPTVTSGYFPSIKKFITQLTVNDNTPTQLGYLKSGDLPTTISWPDASNYAIGTFDPKNMSFTATGSIQYIMASWITFTPNIATLNIYSPRLAPKIGPVPDEMLQAHPGFDLTTANYAPYAVQFYVSGATYENISSGYLEGILPDREQTFVTLMK